jgi:hypothetical protein
MLHVHAILEYCVLGRVSLLRNPFLRETPTFEDASHVWGTACRRYALLVTRIKSGRGVVDEDEPLMDHPAFRTQ